MSEPFNNVTRLQCFNVTIYDDTLVEDTEIFSVGVTLADDTLPVMISPKVSTVEIVDNDGKSVQEGWQGLINNSWCSCIQN